MKRKNLLLAGLMVAAASLGATDGAAEADIDELTAKLTPKLSVANRALFTTDHLESITEPTRLVYDFEKSGSLEPGFKDTVEERITKVLPSGRKNLSFRFLSGKNRVRFQPMYDFVGNPVFMLFLERDAREMERLTGGNALYFRNRIRSALAGSAEVTETSFTFNGATYQGTEIRIQPYLGAVLSKRYPRFARKTYSFILSDDIPGGIYQVKALTPARRSGEALTDERLTFREIADAKVTRNK